MKFLISNLRLLMRRFKSVAIINVAGLAVAFAVSLVVATQAWYDLTYDRGYEHADEIFRAEIGKKGDPEGQVDLIFNQAIPAKLKDNVPEIRAYCLTDWPEDGGVRLSDVHGAPRLAVKVQPVSEGFLDVFTPKIVAGDASRALSVQGHGLLSAGAAATLFGTDDPIGKTIYTEYYGAVVVDAVYEDFPDNSSMINGLLPSLKPQDAGQWGHYAWFRFDPAAYDTVMEKINAITWPDHNSWYDELTFYMTANPRYHIRGGAGGEGGSIDTTIYLVVMGVVIIAVAFINFLNLFMSMAPARVRKINTFRILGSGNGALRVALAAESVLVLLVAMMIGVGLVKWFSGSVFTEFFSADIAPEANIPILATLAATLAAATFVMALYPAHYATSFDMAIALKGSIVLAPRGMRLRNGLIVLQFAVAIFFICFAGYIRLQYDYMGKYSIGYQKENIVYVPAPRDSLSRATFTEELRRNPDIVDLTYSYTPGVLGNSWGGIPFEGREVGFTVWQCAPNTLDFFGVEIVAGNDFSPQPAGGRQQMIVNRKFMEAYGFTAEEVIGKTIPRGRGIEVVGVCADVNFEPLHNEVRPMAFVTTTLKEYNIVASIKIAGDDTPATLKYIEETWTRFDNRQGKSFSLVFLDDALDAQYRRELNMSKLMGILALIAVITAVMGVYVIILFNSRYKTREIAIRKVNGATVGGIAMMLNRGMLMLVGIASVIAVPLTLVFITRWVEGFAYKAAVPWWLFPAGGLMVLVIAVATVSWQSYRAATANPVISLKSE